MTFGRNERAKRHIRKVISEANNATECGLGQGVVEAANVCQAGFGQERVYVRAVMLVLAEILRFGGHQVTSLLRSVG
jgi:hypothetical protein